MDISQLLENQKLICSIAVIAFIALATYRYFKHLYYSFNGYDAGNNMLNKTFHMNERTDIADENKVNLILYGVELSAIALSVLFMILVDGTWGLILYIVLSKALNILASIIVGRKFVNKRETTPAPRQTVPRKIRRQQEREERKNKARKS